MSAPVRVDATGNREGQSVKQNVMLPQLSWSANAAAVRFRIMPENAFILVMVRAGGPPTTSCSFHHRCKVMGGPPTRTMTRVGVCDWQCLQKWNCAQLHGFRDIQDINRRLNKKAVAFGDRDPGWKRIYPCHGPRRRTTHEFLFIAPSLQSHGWSAFADHDQGVCCIRVCSRKATPPLTVRTKREYPNEHNRVSHDLSRLGDARVINPADIKGRGIQGDRACWSLMASHRFIVVAWLR